MSLRRKWELQTRQCQNGSGDLSFPDVNSLPKLAEIFHVSVDELMQVKTDTKGKGEEKQKTAEIVDLALKGVALAMGVAVVVLSILNEMESGSAVRMLGIGLACLAVAQLAQKKDGRE